MRGIDVVNGRKRALLGEYDDVGNTFGSTLKVIVAAVAFSGWRRGAVLSSFSSTTVDRKCFCVDRQRQVPRDPHVQNPGERRRRGTSADFPAVWLRRGPLTSDTDAIRESARSSSAHHTVNSLRAATSAVGMRQCEDRGQRPRILFLSSVQRQATQVLPSFGRDGSAVKHSDLRKRRKFRGQQCSCIS